MVIKIIPTFFINLLRNIKIISCKAISWNEILSNTHRTELGKFVKLYPPYSINSSKIDDYTYISQGAIIKNTTIGKFCSIGPGLLCGWGVHPVDKLTTSPMFYSTLKQNGITLAANDKITEELSISIGNDVFIGMNVTILDGISIGDGAVIGAGAVVSKDIPPYAIAVGNPIRILRYRFDQEKIQLLMKIQWWNFGSEDLKNVELYFADVDAFIQKYSRQ